MRTSDDSGSDDVSDKGSKDGSCNVNLKRVHLMLGDDCTQFKRVLAQKKFIVH